MSTTPFYSIAALAERWCVSQGTARNWLRGHRVLSSGRKCRLLVPAATVRQIEERKTRVFR